MNKQSNQDKIVNAIRNSKGRFFGLRTKGGDSINAQFVSETPSYVVVYDRNRDFQRKLAKSSLAGVSMGKVRVGV
jgi:hypothetical protein